MYFFWSTTHAISTLQLDYYQTRNLLNRIYCVTRNKWLFIIFFLKKPIISEEQKLRAKYAQATRPAHGGAGGGGHSLFLQKRLAKGQKYFDSGDYQVNITNKCRKTAELQSFGSSIFKTSLRKHLLFCSKASNIENISLEDFGGVGESF